MAASDVVWALVSGYPRGEREQRLFMVLQACIDDSGEMEETVNPAFVLAGFIADSEAWAAFSNDWSAFCAKAPRIDYFKMVEAGNKRGQFRGLSDKDIDDKIFGLTAIISKYAILRVSISVDKSSFAKHTRLLKLPIRNHNTDKPYCIAFQRLLLEIPKMQLLHASVFGSKPKPIDFIFDEQGEVGIEAQSTWQIIKRLSERLAQQGRTDLRPCLGNAPTFNDEKHFVPLQAADLYAWNVRRFFYENKHLVIPVNSYLRSLASIPPIHVHIGESELTELRYGTLSTHNQFIKENPNTELLSHQGSKKQQKKNRAMKRAEVRASRKRGDAPSES